MLISVNLIALHTFFLLLLYIPALLLNVWMMSLQIVDWSVAPTQANWIKNVYMINVCCIHSANSLKKHTPIAANCSSAWVCRVSIRGSSSAVTTSCVSSDVNPYLDTSFCTWHRHSLLFLSTQLKIKHDIFGFIFHPETIDFRQTGLSSIFKQFMQYFHGVTVQRI